MGAVASRQPEARLTMRRERARAYCAPLALVLIIAFFTAGAVIAARDVISWLS